MITFSNNLKSIVLKNEPVVSIKEKPFFALKYTVVPVSVLVPFSGPPLHDLPSVLTHISLV